MKQLLSRVAGTFGLRIASMLLTFSTTVILARLLDTKSFGMYTYVMSWVVLLTIPATMGFDGLMGREISIFQTQSSWSKMSGLVKMGQFSSLCLSVLIGLIGSLIFWQWHADGNDQLFHVFCLGMTALPLIACGRVCRGVMRGLHKIVYGLIPELVLSPLLFLVFIGCAVLIDRSQLTAEFSMGAFVIASGGALFVSILMLNRSLPGIVSNAVPRFLGIDWMRAALPFMLFESVNILNQRIDILMLGAMKGVEYSGLYTPINRGTQLIVFILIAFVGPLSPKIASLYAEGKISVLKQTLKKTNRLVFLISSVFAVLLIILGSPYLTIYGADFTQGISALQIRCVGRLLYSTVGLSSMVLTMAGFASASAIFSFGGALLNIGLNFLLIPQYGLTGAAIATSSTLLIVGGANALWAYRKIGINSTMFVL